MPKMVSATEAKNRLGALFSWIQDNHDTVIVESRGEPTAVIMSYSEYEKIQALQEQARRQEIWERMEALRREISARNQDLTEEAAEELADRFTRDVIDDMVREGKITFRKA